MAAQASSSTDALLATDSGRRLSVAVTRSEDADKSHHVSGGFVNPWPSWVKPSLYELWSGLSWWDGDQQQQQKSQESNGKTTDPPRQLEILQPDFTTPSSSSDIKSWWLGHAGLLIEFEGPLRVLFDPIFSLRCSPTQYAGPRRFYDSPCSVEDLPPIDVVCISHNHYDHLDFDTIRETWEQNRERGVKFIVPLGNRAWFESLVGPEDGEDIIVECDWWDEVRLALPDTDRSLTIASTPAQHGSGRLGLDGGSSLWCSYYLTYKSSSSTRRIYFGGDTGYRLRPPPSASSTQSFPACPAFSQIHAKYSAPDYLFLPISVGSTYSYVKSWDPFGLVFPQVDGGLTAQNHLDEWEAVEVAKILCGNENAKAQVVAIHFGTFSPPAETGRNMRQLGQACQGSGWDLVRTQRGVERAREGGDKGRFYVLDHGARLDLP